MRNRKRVVVADDAANLDLDGRDNGCRIQHDAILAYAARLGTVVQAGIYFPRHSGMERERGQVIALKQAAGFTELEVRPVRQRSDGTYKSDIDTVITMSLWGAALLGMADVVVLASGDSDFVPLVEGLVQRGIEVHVIGPENATAIELAVAASCFTYTRQVPGLVQPVTLAPAPTCAKPTAEERSGERSVVTGGNGQQAPVLPTLQKPF